MRFLLDALLTSEENGIIETNRFQKTYRINLLREDKKLTTIYDSELKVYLEKKTEPLFFYEVEAEWVVLSLCDQLEKAEDFIRRLNYRYDWAEPEVNALGCVIAIQNKEELCATWEELKQNIKDDYIGEAVDKAITEIDQEFETEESIRKTICQYLHLGLLFPEIPLKHSNVWSRRRMAQFSEYEDETFEEEITYERMDNANRIYSVSGRSLPESRVHITRFEGEIVVPENQILPYTAKLYVTCQTGIINHTWLFKLDCYY